MPTLDDIFSQTADVAALAYFLGVIAAYRLIADWRLIQRPSIAGAVQDHRVRWMINMASRADHRTMDVILLNNLSQGNAFFASTSAIAIGGVTALLGSGERIAEIVARLPMAAKAGPALTEFKMLLLVAILIYAFFKFAWAFRLSHYCGIMIGSTPILSDATRDDCEIHARRAARLIGLAGSHANSGLRAYYHAMAAMAWFYHPLLLILATTWVAATMIRRDFFSRSRAVLAGDWPPTGRT